MMRVVYSLTVWVSVLKIGFSYPIPERKVTRLLKSVKQVLVIEDGDPFVEGQNNRQR